MSESVVGAKRFGRVFYGWWIVLASGVGFAVMGALYFYGFSAFFVPLEREFGWSRMELSGAFSLSRLEGGLAGPVGGFLVDKLGPRKVMTFGILLTGGGFIWLSQIESLLMFYVVFIGTVAMGFGVGISIPSLVAINNWFVRKRTLANGLAISGMGVAGLLVPVVALLIVNFGWRTTAVIAGIAVWVICLPVALVIRHRPEQYGTVPDGVPVAVPGEETAKTPSGNAVKGATEDNLDGDFTARQALGTPVFWLLALAFGLRQVVMSAVVVHAIPFFVGIGMSEARAASLLGMLAVISVVGRLGFGWLGDRFAKRYVFAGALLLMAVGSAILAIATSFWHVLLFLAVYPPGYGGGATVMFSMRAEYFGRRNFGTISGLMDFFQTFGMVLGPIFAGWVFDVTGSYRIAFITFAICAAVGVLTVLTSRRPKLKLSSQE